MANLQIYDNLFSESFTIAKQYNTMYTLSTSGTYVDKDIQLSMNARSTSASVAGTASAGISSLSYVYDSINGNFSVTGTAAISGTTTLTVDESGWLETGFTGEITGTASLSNVTVPKIGVGATMSGSKVTPIISRTSTTTTSGTAINVGTTSATTAAPSSGYFISVQSASTTNTAYAMPNVASAGYGTIEYFSSTTATLTVGANESAITYIPIATGIAAADSASADVTLYTTDGSNNGVNISAILGTKATTEPTSGYYLAFTASGSGNSKVTTAGWFPTGSLTTASTTSEAKYYPVATAVYSITGGGLTASTGYASVSSDGYYNGSSYDTTDKVDITSQTSQASGYYKITASGYGTVNRAAINRQATTAGYLPTDSSAIQVSAATNLNSGTGTQAYYIKKSVLSTSTYNSSNVDQTITIPEGYAPERTITVNKMATVNPTTDYANIGLDTYFTAGTSSNKDVSITPRYSTTAGYVAAQTNKNNGGTGYWKIIPSTATYTTSSRTDTYGILAGYCSSAQLATYTAQAYGRYKVSGNTYKLTTEQIEALASSSSGDQTIAVYRRSASSVSRGSATISAGWVDADEIISAAIFANVPSSGTTYIDLTESSAMPILDSGGKLYINAGYVDNVMVDLGQFIPEEANISSSDELVSGSSGINNEGELIVGNLNLYDSSNLRAVGRTVYVPSNGYFLTTASCAVATGTYAVSQTQLNPGVAAATVNINNQATYGFTTTAPSAGTYVTISPTLTTTDWQISAKAEITKAGYLYADAKTTTYTGSVNTSLGDDWFIPAVTATFSGGALSQTAVNAITTNMDTSSSATYYIDAFAATTVVRAITQYSNAAGVIETHNNATAIAQATIDASSTAPRVYVPTAEGSITLTAGSGHCNYSTATNVTVSDTNTSGVSITFDGSGEVSGLAQITTAGYTPVNNNFATASSTTSSSATATKYITKIKLEAPSTGTRTFDIEVPNGSPSEYIVFRYTVDSSGNVTIEGV